MKDAEFDKLLDKITEGVQLSIKRLIENAKKEDGELAIAKDGKVITIKARDLKEESESGN